MLEHWEVPCFPEEEIAALSAQTKRHPILTKILWNRGCRDAQAVHRFLSRSCDVLYDPFLMQDMQQAAQILCAAIASKTHITVFGDYDADGITATAVLYRFLADAGAAVDCYIPSRAEGYGLNCAAIDSLCARGTELIVTVDNGSVAFEQAEYIYQRGMQLLITDHHTCLAEQPRCEAFLNPHRVTDTYPFRELAGVGVVFKLICACQTLDVTDTQEKINRVHALCYRFCFPVMIGTIADVMPLTGENRLLVSIGLSFQQTGDWPGLYSLIYCIRKTAGKRVCDGAYITSGFVAYFLAPRLNAAGRIASAQLALDLLLADNLRTGDILAEQLCSLNTARQQTEASLLQQTEQLIREKHDLHAERILVLWGDDWHPGVLGIVASRLTEKYRKPTILISFSSQEQPAIGRGSGRSVAGFSLIDALHAVSMYLEGCGGHALAAGLTIRRENIDAFCSALQAYAQPSLPCGIPTKYVRAECELALPQVSMELAEALAVLEPFGCENPTPLFVARAVNLTELMPVGDGSHTRIRLRFDTQMLTAMYFRHAPEDIPFVAGDDADLLFSVDVNVYGGEKRVQLLVKGIGFPQAQQEAFDAEMEPFRRFCAGEVGDYFSMMPNRQEFAELYRYLQAHTPLDTDLMTLAKLMQLPGPVAAVALRCFAETGLLEPYGEMDPVMHLVLREHHGKVDLYDAPTMSQIRNLLRALQ